MRDRIDEVGQGASPTPEATASTPEAQITQHLQAGQQLLAEAEEILRLLKDELDTALALMAHLREGR